MSQMVKKTTFATSVENKVKNTAFVFTGVIIDVAYVVVPQSLSPSVDIYDSEEAKEYSIFHTTIGNLCTVMLLLLILLTFLNCRYHS